jgi:hypothetical protein
MRQRKNVRNLKVLEWESLLGMKTKDLQLANKIQVEIDELESFIWVAEKVWKGNLISRLPVITFKSNSYGIISSREYEMGTTVKNKVLEVLREHLESLKRRLEDI